MRAGHPMRNRTQRTIALAVIGKAVLEHGHTDWLPAIEPFDWRARGWEPRVATRAIVARLELAPEISGARRRRSAVFASSEARRRAGSLRSPSACAFKRQAMRRNRCARFEEADSSPKTRR